jgi:peptide-methionine (S)-S-oxide reductase
MNPEREELAMPPTPWMMSRRVAWVALAALSAATVGVQAQTPAPVAPKERTPMDTATPPEAPKLALATLGGGCFWCLEAPFERVPGVKSVVSGYAGGTTPRPNYHQVSTGMTGHAEVVQITYDPAVVSYDDLLYVFWQLHDPTTLNRQGPDYGTQYRSIILAHNQEQYDAAVASRDRLAASGTFPNPIVTEIVPLKAFHKAEAYHQNYYKNNPQQPYCRMMIAPKLQKLKLPKPKGDAATP